MLTVFFKWKILLLSILVLVVPFQLQAEEKDSLENKVYKVNLYVDLPITVVAHVANIWGLNVVDSKPHLDSLTIINLDANNINRFDRSATRQDAGFAPKARSISDIGQYGSYALPLLLLFDQEIRRDWAPLLLLYMETQGITGTLYSWGSVVHIDRIRPLVYNPDVPWDEKTGARTKNAFYSGHTSSSASASFFVAKVYCDYHPEMGNKKFIIYSIALVPPVFTGFFRYKGMKHFPTDVLTGLVVGATTGILTPHLHKIVRSDLSIVPFAGQVNGLALSLRF